MHEAFLLSEYLFCCSSMLGFESVSNSGSGLLRSTLRDVRVLFGGFVCLNVMYALRGFLGV
jgi:hypothetical protein